MTKRSVVASPIVFAVLTLAATSAPASDASTGRAAPAFELPSLDGERVDLADFRGQLVVLHFGAGW